MKHKDPSADTQSGARQERQAILKEARDLRNYLQGIPIRHASDETKAFVAEAIGMARQLVTFIQGRAARTGSRAGGVGRK